MRYVVYISEIRYGSVAVEADSKEEAETRVRKVLENQQCQDLIEWHDAEISDVTAD